MSAMADLEEPLLSMVKLGMLKLQQRKFGESEHTVLRALDVARQRRHSVSETVVMDLLSSVAVAAEDYPKAEKLTRAVMRRMIDEGTSPTDLSLINRSLSMANIQSKLKNFALAEVGFEATIDLLQEKLKGTNYLEDSFRPTGEDIHTLQMLGMGKDWYGIHHLKYGRFKEAKQCFEDALRIAEKVKGPSHDITLSLLCKISAMQSSLNEHDSAIALLKEAIARGVSVLSADVPLFYYNLAGAFILGQRSRVEALEACEEALQLSKCPKLQVFHEKAKELRKQLLRGYSDELTESTRATIEAGGFFSQACWSS